MKHLFLSFLLIVAGAMIFVSCDGGSSSSDDKTKADLAWDNESSGTVKDIKWVSNGSTDQTWSGSFDVAVTTESKGITQLTGQGECLTSTDEPAQLLVEPPARGSRAPTLSVTIPEGSTTTLVISQFQKK